MPPRSAISFAPWLDTQVGIAGPTACPTRPPGAGSGPTINALTEPSTVEGNLMTINILESLDNKQIYNLAYGADPRLDFVVCPKCATTAAVQRRRPVQSTDGPVEHVHITCVNRHWFMMPADMLNERSQKSPAVPICRIQELARYAEAARQGRHKLSSAPINR
jgi:hypothetical protein